MRIRAVVFDLYGMLTEELGRAALRFDGFSGL